MEGHQSSNHPLGDPAVNIQDLTGFHNANRVQVSQRSDARHIIGTPSATIPHMVIGRSYTKAGLLGVSQASRNVLRVADSGITLQLMPPESVTFTSTESTGSLDRRHLAESNHSQTASPRAASDP